MQDDELITAFCNDGYVLIRNFISEGFVEKITSILRDNNIDANQRNIEQHSNLIDQFVKGELLLNLTKFFFAG